MLGLDLHLSRRRLGEGGSLRIQHVLGRVKYRNVESLKRLLSLPVLVAVATAAGENFRSYVVETAESGEHKLPACPFRQLVKTPCPAFF